MNLSIPENWTLCHFNTCCCSATISMDLPRGVRREMLPTRCHRIGKAKPVRESCGD